MRFFENKPHSGLGVDHELILFGSDLIEGSEL
jgi:hypothetical protein